MAEDVRQQLAALQDEKHRKTRLARKCLIGSIAGMAGSYMLFMATMSKVFIAVFLAFGALAIIASIADSVINSRYDRKRKKIKDSYFEN